MIICAFENPPQFHASWWQRLFTLDMATSQLKKWLIFLLPFHSCAPCIFISYCCVCQCQAVCYYYMPEPTKYHWNISFQKKCSSAKYVVKNAKNVTQFVWQPFSIEFQGFVKKKMKYILSNNRANSLHGSKKIESYDWDKNCNIWSSLILPPPSL